MSFFEYLKYKWADITINVLGMAMIGVFLIFMDNDIHTILIIDGGWIFVLTLYFLVEYVKKKKHYEDTMKRIKTMDKRYLFGETMEEPHNMDGNFYHEIMRIANKSMVDKIGEMKLEQKEYKEYIEQWVHEIKSPIAGIKLMGENNKSTVTRRILGELQRVESYVEQVLYYARSEHVEKDFFVRSVNLEECVSKAMVNSKYMIIKSGMDVQMEDVDIEVLSDEKWLVFILNQIISNSAKYTKDDDARLKIYTEKDDGGQVLVIEDNGRGIKSEDVDRVFQKGFTGEGGRVHEKATGIGLYLVKQLTDKLGHEVSIQSKYGEGTSVKIYFNRSSVCNVTKVKH